MTWVEAPWHGPEPWACQREAFTRFKDARYFGLLMEQRTGKSKVVCTIAAYRYLHGMISTLVIVADPSGVHRNWVEKECPEHLTPTVRPYYLAWRPGLLGTRAGRLLVEGAVEHDGLTVAAFNAESLCTKDAAALIKQLLARGRGALLFADESDFMANNASQQTRAMGFYGQRAAWRGLGSGTPFEEGPFDAFPQLNFLSERILNQPSFRNYKNRYAEMGVRYLGPSTCPLCAEPYGYPARGCAREGCPVPPQAFPEVKKDETGKKKFRNIEELIQLYSPHCIRVLRKDVSDAPPKVYQTHRIQLAPEQRRVYDELHTQSLAELGSGRMVTAALGITKLLRLQQVACNYWPSSDEPEEHQACGGAGCEECGWLGLVVVERELERIVPAEDDPRLNGLHHVLRRETGPAIIWTRFRPDVEEISRRFQVPALYGSTPDDERQAIRRRFASGEINRVVATPDVGGRGYDFSRAALMVFYANSNSLRQRLQAEDRGEAIMKTFSTGIVDIVAEDTVDLKIARNLVNKKSVADLCHGDDPAEWLRP